jgi:hypothetical protein
MEGASPRGGSALSPAAVGGRRLKTGKKLRLVKKNTVRKILAVKGLRMRGGADAGTAENEVVKEDGTTAKAASVLPGLAGGRRRRKTAGRRKGRRSSRRGLFGKLF